MTVRQLIDKVTDLSEEAWKNYDVRLEGCDKCGKSGGMGRTIEKLRVDNTRRVVFIEYRRV